MDSIPGSRRSPGGGHGNPFQYSYLENPMDRWAWRDTIHRVTKSQTRLKWLSTHKSPGQPPGLGRQNKDLSTLFFTTSKTHDPKHPHHWRALLLALLVSAVLLKAANQGQDHSLTLNYSTPLNYPLWWKHINTGCPLTQPFCFASLSKRQMQFTSNYSLATRSEYLFSSYWRFSGLGISVFVHG